MRTALLLAFATWIALFGVAVLTHHAWQSLSARIDGIEHIVFGTTTDF